MLFEKYCRKEIAQGLVLLIIAVLNVPSCSSNQLTSPNAAEPTRDINQNANSPRCQPTPVHQFYRQFLDQYSEEHKICSLQKAVPPSDRAALPNTVIVIRSMQARFAGRVPAEHFVLAVNPQTLETSLLPSDCVTACHDFNPAEHATELPYARALSENGTSSGPQHEESSRSEIYLTADLCPSKKALDVELFSKIDSHTSQATPVALSIAGGWIKHHQKELAVLKKLALDGRIRITWVNHSYSHPYNKDLPLEHNFLLESGVDLAHEVFDNEKLMLFNGLLPSVFFRFPGLVSDGEEAHKLRVWGLIPVSADAWLAKGQKIITGSIILVHANGNEPLGLNLLYKELEARPELRSLFGDLNDAFVF